MPRSWTSSPDVHLGIDVAPGRGKRRALEQALRDAIHAARLGPGTLLPSSRGLAADLGLSRGTVVEAYAQLQSEGYLVTRPGGSTAVAEAGPVPAESAHSTQRRATEAPAPPGPSYRFDLRPGLLDLSRAFPRRQWMASVRSVLNQAPDAGFDYGDPRGRPELRRALSRYLARARGVVADPEQIVICLGFAHGLSLLTQALGRTGRTTWAMEDPCLPAHPEIARRAGVDVVPLPVDGSGARPSALAKLGADVAVVTPAHQYPTGVTLQPERRAELLAWARATDGVVVEDDYDGEFRYDRQPVGALQGLGPDHVVYAGTTSKTIAPGLRIGWLVLPARLLDPVVDLNRTALGGALPPALEQLALTDFIERGSLDRHLRSLRAEFRRRRDRLVAALSKAAPDLHTTGVAAGLHVLIDLADSGLTERVVADAAAAEGVGVAVLGTHWHGRTRTRRRPSQALVVGYARPTPPQFDNAVRALVRALRSAPG
jgi:GntR family transcriptional regulator/MocR family aminotransferase